MTQCNFSSVFADGTQTKTKAMRMLRSCSRRQVHKIVLFWICRGRCSAPSVMLSMIKPAITVDSSQRSRALDNIA